MTPTLFDAAPFKTLEGRVRDAILEWLNDEDDDKQALRDVLREKGFQASYEWVDVSLSWWERIWTWDEAVRYNAGLKTDYDRDMNHYFADLYRHRETGQFVWLMGRTGNTMNILVEEEVTE